MIDETDIKILRALQEDARQTTKELAAKVNLSTTPVFERLKRLEREGYIRQYVAILDAEKLDLGFEVYCSVKLKQMSRDVARDFTRMIRQIPQVAECYNISGEYDYLLKIRARNMKQYNDFIINTLGALDTIKHSYGLYLSDSPVVKS